MEVPGCCNQGFDYIISSTIAGVCGGHQSHFNRKISCLCTRLLAGGVQLFCSLKNRIVYILRACTT